LLGAGRLEDAVHSFDAWQALPDKDMEEAARGVEVAGVLPAARLLVDQLRAPR
jgi:hypothetical protein